VQRLATDTQLARRLRDPQAERRQHVLAQEFARVDGRGFRGSRNNVLFLSCHRLGLSVILLKVDAPRVALDPLESDPPRAVHVDRVSLRRSVKRVDTKAWVNQVARRLGLVERAEDAPRSILEVRPHTCARPAHEQIAQALVTETPNHAPSVA